MNPSAMQRIGFVVAGDAPDYSDVVLVQILPMRTDYVIRAVTLQEDFEAFLGELNPGILLVPIQKQSDSAGFHLWAPVSQKF
jgi:hypothetical protein